MKIRSKSTVFVTLLLLVCFLLVVAYAWLNHYKPNSSSSEERSTHSIKVDGQDRSYTLFIPKSVRTDHSAPLVVMLHGALGTSEQAETTYNWDDKASEKNFIVAYPEGLNRSWVVSEGCCGPSLKKDVSDVKFIEQMIADIKRLHAIDERRLYATGISNGGALAYRLACDATTFAAVGVVASTLLGDCPSPSPVSVMHIHGLADETFPYEGGGGRRNNDGQGDRPADTRGPSIPELMSKWRGIDACEPSAITSEGVVTKSISKCDDAKAVELITIAGAGHQWPGAKANAKSSKRLALDPPSTALNATEALWDFFESHPK